MDETKSYKKFISPGAWFSMNYPSTWNEFEDEEAVFLFYNPDKWTGNFRISAFKGEKGYGKNFITTELKDNPTSQIVTINNLQCAYSKEDFVEKDAHYTTHIWITGIENISFECTFTCFQDAPITEAEKIIASLEVRQEHIKYPPELIPVRLSEIYQINEAYEWVEKKIKELLKKDFQGSEEDIPAMQQIMEQGNISRKKRETWLAFGIVLCVILTNEVDGIEWRTLIDGNREAPVLYHTDTGTLIDPMKLVWSKIKANESCDLADTYREMQLSLSRD